MKKLFTLLCFIALVKLNAQAPVIEGTYYPVRNTSIKQVWDTTFNSMSVPSVGPNQVWDYRFANGQFLHVVDTFSFKFIDPSATPFASMFPGATHATFMRTPFNNISDSLYSYWEVNQGGLYNLGGYSKKHAFDTILKNTKKEFYAPQKIMYLNSYTDTAKFTAFANHYAGYRAKIKGTKIKTATYVGYGTLKLPNGTYNNVALIKEVNSEVDSVYIDFAHNGNYTYVTKTSSSAIVYEFLRNNTFGSAYLMYLSANPSNTAIAYGWYTMPVDFGSISGTVFTDKTEATKVTSGEMYLYREHSNFTKHDILAKTTLDANGNYKFDSIPYGEYLIAVRPNLTTYQNSLITYVGDTTNWVDASSIITTTTTSPGHKIHLRYHNPPTGMNSISGQLNLNLNIARTNGILQSNPVPGIGIVVKKNPGGTTNARLTVSDTSGKFVLNSLNDGNYTMFVDIPGLHMAGTYSFSVVGGNVVNGLDFVVGTDSIHPASLVSGIKETKKTDVSFIRAYPNPYNSSATIELLLQNSANVTLEVYNMIGEKIQTLDNSQKTAGTYKYSFSAKSQNYSAGIYFVKCKVGNSSSVIKLIEQ